MSNVIENFKKRDFNKLFCCYTIKIPVTKTLSIIGNRPWVSFNMTRQINQAIIVGESGIASVIENKLITLNMILNEYT